MRKYQYISKRQLSLWGHCIHLIRHFIDFHVTVYISKLNNCYLHSFRAKLKHNRYTIAKFEVRFYSDVHTHI